MKVSVILPAAGSGRRFGAVHGAPSKIEIDLAGRPVFMRAVELFNKRSEVSQIILAVHPERYDEFRLRHGDGLGFHGVTLVEGGRKERWETVLKALEVVNEDCTHIAVHDAARPLTSAQLIDRIFETAQRHPAVIPAISVSNTLKRAEPFEDKGSEQDQIGDILGVGAGAPGGRPKLHKVTQTVDRRGMFEVQTPQMFDRKLLCRAYEQVEAGKIDSSSVTDDASLIEAMGEPVVIVPGEAINLKITRPGDAEIAKAVFGRRGKRGAIDEASKRLFRDD